MDITPTLFSPPRDILAYHLSKYVNESADLKQAVSVQTICGNLIIDTVVYLPESIVGFQINKKRDLMDSDEEWRDAIILGDKAVEKIFSIPAKAIVNKIEDVLYVLSRWAPEIFSERGKINLDILASKTAKSYRLRTHGTMARLTYRSNNKPKFLYLEKREVGLDNFADGIYGFAREMGGGSLSTIHEEWRRRKGIPSNLGNRNQKLEDTNDEV